MRSIIIFVLVWFVGLIPTVTEAKKPKCKDLSFPVYDSDSAPQPYVVIGKVYVEFGPVKQEKILCELRRATLKHGGDAILSYTSRQQDTAVGGPGTEKPSLLQFLFGTSMNVVTTATNRSYGVIVRWAKTGERGVEKITEATPILVIY